MMDVEPALAILRGLRDDEMRLADEAVHRNWKWTADQHQAKADALLLAIRKLSGK